MGRQLHGHKLLADSQHKGISHYSVTVSFIRSSTHWIYKTYQPWFSKECGRCSSSLPILISWTKPLDTYLDMTGFGKGVTLSTATSWLLWRLDRPLMCSSGFLKEGSHSLTVLWDRRAAPRDTSTSVQQPTFKEVKGENLMTIVGCRIRWMPTTGQAANLWPNQMFHVWSGTKTNQDSLCLLSVCIDW